MAAILTTLPTATTTAASGVRAFTATIVDDD